MKLAPRVISPLMTAWLLLAGAAAAAMATTLLLASAAAAPPPLPPWYTVRWHTQPVDHFNALANATFSQRFLVNETWWKPEGPILFYTGAEGGGINTTFAHSGPVLELGRKLGALVVFAEMRFFGRSMPFGERGSFSNLGLLSVEQALADYASLITALRREYKAETSPAIAVGGSLAGSLAFFLRYKYPTVVDMGLVSSAPILGYPGLTDQFGWYRVATQTYEAQSPGCPAVVRSHFGHLLAASAPTLTAVRDSPRSELRNRPSPPYLCVIWVG